MKMRFPRPLIAAAALLLTTATVSLAGMVGDISGRWLVAVNMQDRTTESMVTFQQKGDSLTGSIDIPDLGVRPLVGTVRGDTVRFDFSVDMQGTVLEIQADGLVKDDSTIDGTLVLPSGMGSFPFAAKRQP